MKEKNKLQNQNGVTLIALVITIIVLIILAMISIAMLTGENGLLNKSLEAKIENAHGEIRERLELETQYLLAERLEGTSTEDLMTYLKGKNYVNDNGVVNIKELTKNSNLVTGKGSAESGKDIYKVEEKATSTGNISKIASTEPVKIAATDTTNEEKKYDINYYDENGKVRKIGQLQDVKLSNNNNSTSGEGPKEETITFYFNVMGSSWSQYQEELHCKKGTTWGEYLASDEVTGRLKSDNYKFVYSSSFSEYSKVPWPLATRDGTDQITATSVPFILKKGDRMAPSINGYMTQNWKETDDLSDAVKPEDEIIANQLYSVYIYGD